MRKARIVVLGLAPLVLLSCTSVGPAKINLGDQCFRCGRTINDSRLAGEQIAAFVEKFRAPGCMAKYVVKNPGDTGPIFVTDYTTGKMVKPSEAFFVPTVLDRNTGERDYRAYASKADADAAAAEARSETVDWKTVLDRARSQT
jgi:hypothetical protein